MDVHSRKEWRARPPRPRSRQSARNVREFFLHWNGSVPGSFAHVNTVAEESELMRQTQNFHMDTRGWSDFAYSYAIMPSGRLYMGRGIGYVPASQLGHNTNTVSCILFVGPDDKLTDTVKDAVKWLRRHIEKAAGHSVDVRAHRDVGGTECPGDVIARFAHSL